MIAVDYELQCRMSDRARLVPPATHKEMNMMKQKARSINLSIDSLDPLSSFICVDACSECAGGCADLTAGCARCFVSIITLGGL
jgi:hypothetical protein